MTSTEEARRADIAAKAAAATETLSIPWQNGRRTLHVINVSLDNVLLNPNSHRIRSQVESHVNADQLQREPFSESAQDFIADILREFDGFQSLVDSLHESSQLEPGIITAEGVLINANNRAVALRDLNEKYIRVGVLPEEATTQEITELEARLQLAKDYKQDYTFTNELLFIQEQIDAGMSYEDLAILLGKAQSRRPAHLRKGVADIEQSLRILQHIREVQEMSGKAIKLTFFDPHQSALVEADSAYQALREQDPAQARRVRDGRMAGVLVGVTYRNLRNWDSDHFLRDYVEPQFDHGDLLTAIDSSSIAGDGQDAGDGLDIFEETGQEDRPVDPSRMLAAAAQRYGADDEATVGGITKRELFDGLHERFTQAAEEKGLDLRDERRKLRPIDLVVDARKKVSRAREALKNAQTERGFDRGKFGYEIRRLRKELDSLAEAGGLDG